MKQQYQDLRLRPDTLELIRLINSIINSYLEQGFTLSVRQLYYQLVARALIENTEKSYKRIASVINDGRLAGLIDWEAIEDRNRDVQVRSRWRSGSEIIGACASSFHMDMWDNQQNRVIVIVEKAALAGVLDGVCTRFDVPLLAARGYPSVSIVREMALEHIVNPLNQGQRVTVLHLGDHDPSGIDMTRDLDERIRLFTEAETDTDGLEICRIALTMGQIEEVNPPPNPAKVTDSRFDSYARQFGDESWELDALNPQYLVDLVTGHLEDRIDSDAWSEREQEISEVRARLSEVAIAFDD